MTTPRLILGSGSFERQRLLHEAGYDFEIVNPREAVECGICSTGGPAALVVELAASKALDVAAQLRGRIATPSQRRVILACDTVAECGGEVLGKPRDEAHARSMLTRLSGSLHRVYSGVCVWPLDASSESPDPDVRLATSELQMDPLDALQIEHYLASGLWRGKAGAFGLQDRPGWLHLVSGSESNVMGLPMELTAEMLRAHGVDPRAADD
jgi:septum formation protein